MVRPDQVVGVNVLVARDGPSSLARTNEPARVSTDSESAIHASRPFRLRRLRSIGRPQPVPDADFRQNILGPFRARFQLLPQRADVNAQVLHV